MENSELQLVDVDKVLKTRNEKLYRLLPKFVIKYLQHIIHQDEINEVLQKSHLKYYGSEFADFLIKDFNVKLNLIHEEKIPLDGKLTIVSNHPLGGFDGIALISLFSKFRKDVKVPVNDLLMHVPNLQSVFMPINKTGKNTIDLARNFENLFSSNNTILYFPAGLCSRKIKGQIVDLEWKKTFITKTKQYGHDILPIFFDGKNSNFFYNLAKIRTFLGIKINIEMAFLANEFFKQRNSKFNIIVGDVIKNEQLFAMGKTDSEIAKTIKTKVYQLREELNKK